jgi:hypothetical protein
MTLLVNLYGGPGTGKSTSAALIFSRLKMDGKNAELVKETAKDWAWEKRHIDAYSQFYLMGRQIRRESMLLGKVSHIVTDAPVMLYDYYAQKYSPPAIAAAVSGTVDAYYRQLRLEGHEVLHVFLKRSKAYNPEGRYQTEEEAREIDRELVAMMMDRPMKYTFCDTEQSVLETLARSL